MELAFTDGIRVKTDGPYRTLRLRDGWYVTGHGCLIPCDDRDQALETVKELKDTEPKN